ncbi:MAG: tyrosine-type recombinase/integrase [Clostridiales bacterium]|jgi:integrase|nr:tyrosine-type recombinase/integrase [Clostridiales bacterium]
MSTTQPIRDKKQISELSNYYLDRGQIRNHLLIVLSVHTALRISDILRLTWDDVYDFDNSRVRKSITIAEKKTKKAKTIALHQQIIKALTVYAQVSKKRVPLFLNKRTGKAISRTQAYRIIRTAAEKLQFQARVSCHSLRKTFGYHAWKSGVSPVIIMDIYNHSSLATTRRYLGVTQDDKNAVYVGLNLIG